MPDIQKQLAASGMRTTPERARLLEVLGRAKKPLSSKELHEKVTGAMDRVTVYRNLEAFVDAGIIRKIDVGHRHAHYEVLGETEHHHLICTGCSHMEDVKWCPDPNETTRILKESKRFARIHRHALEFYGLCTNCAKKA